MLAAQTKTVRTPTRVSGLGALEIMPEIMARPMGIARDPRRYRAQLPFCVPVVHQDGIAQSDLHFERFGLGRDPAETDLAQYRVVGGCDVVESAKRPGRSWAEIHVGNVGERDRERKGSDSWNCKRNRMASGFTHCV